MTKTQKIVVAVVGVALGFFALAAYFRAPSVAPTGQSSNLGGADIVEQYPSYWVNGINIGGRFTNNVKLVLGDGQNQVAWKNTTGQVVLASGVQGFISPSAKTSPAVASSTLAFFVGTSTTSTITDSAAPVFGSLIDTYLIATSTTNTLAIDSFGDKGTNGQQVITVLPNQYVIAVLENPYNQACTGATCETATSTNRGYNLPFSFNYSFLNN